MDENIQAASEAGAPDAGEIFQKAFADVAPHMESAAIMFDRASPLTIGDLAVLSQAISLRRIADALERQEAIITASMGAKKEPTPVYIVP